MRALSSLRFNQPVHPVTFRPGVGMRPGLLPLERLTLIEGLVENQYDIYKWKKNKLVYRYRPRRWRPRSTVRYPALEYGEPFLSTRRRPGNYRPQRAARPNEFYNPDLRDGASW